MDDDSKSLHWKWFGHQQTSIKRWLFGVPGLGKFSQKFSGTPYPYYSHTTPIRFPTDMGIVWETCHKSQLGVPGITLDKLLQVQTGQTSIFQRSFEVPVKGGDRWHFYSPNFRSFFTAYIPWSSPCLRLGVTHSIPTTHRKPTEISLRKFTSSLRSEKAGELLEQVLDGRRKIFGIKHMDTIISMNNLASIQEAVGWMEFEGWMDGCMMSLGKA